MAQAEHEGFEIERRDEVDRALADTGAASRHARDHLLEGMPQCNIVVLGKTGVGKSTLLNAVFGQDLAKTGVGKPVTTHIEGKNVDGIPVTIFDTRGIELKDDPDTVIREFEAEIERRLRDSQESWFHVLWYCVNAGGTRIEEDEAVKIIPALGGRMKTIVVVTRSLGPDDEDTGPLVEAIRRENLPVVDVLPVLALERKVAGTTIQPHGLEALVEATTGVVPDAVRAAFVNSQVIEFDEKRDSAFTHVDEFVSRIDTGYRPLKFLENPITHTSEEAEYMAARAVRLIGEVAAIYGTGTTDDQVLEDLAVVAVGDWTREEGASRWADRIGTILLLLPPVGPTAPVRYGGKLLAALAGALTKNSADQAARKRAALALRVLGRAAVRTLDAAARHAVQRDPMGRQEIATLFERFVEEEARGTAET